MRLLLVACTAILVLCIVNVAVMHRMFSASNPGCAVFFDDLWSNKKYADDVGIPFEKVDPDYGVSVTNVKDGIDKVRKGCACGVG